MSDERFVTIEDPEQAKALGVPVGARIRLMEVADEPERTTRTYKAALQIYRVDEDGDVQLLGTASTVEASTLFDAFEPLSSALGTAWNSLVQTARGMNPEEE